MTRDETSGVNNAANCYKDAVGLQFSASFVTSQFASSWRNWWNGNGFSIFDQIRRELVTLIKTANTLLKRQVSCASFIGNLLNVYFSCTGIRQIRVEIWLEPDLAGFRICRSRNPVQPYQ